MQKYLWLLGAPVITLLLFFAIPIASRAQSSTQTPIPNRPNSARFSPSLTHTLYLPLVTNTLPDSCAAIPNQSYGTVEVFSAPTDRPADQHADLNLGLRGYTATNQALALVTYGIDPDQPPDANAPQLATLFAPQRLPVFTSTFSVGIWDWGCNCRTGWITDPVVSLIGMQTGIGEIISAPSSGYDIGLRPATGYEVMVLYATTQRITLKYTREDNVVLGYTIHIENICTEPGLLALYNYWNAPPQNRSRLPALNAAQPLGRAKQNQILVSIRDTGWFMDPRSRLDWWQGY